MKPEKLWAFASWGMVQDLNVLLKEMKKSEVSIDEMIEFIDDLVRDERNRRQASKDETKRMMVEINTRLRRCESCGNSMNLFPVNDTPCTQVGNGYQSVWECPDIMGCGETVYNTLNVYDTAKLYGLERYYPTPEEAEARRARIETARTKREAAIRRHRQNVPQSKCGGGPR